MQRRKKVALTLTVFVVGFFIGASSVSANPRRPAVANNGGRVTTNVVVETEDLKIETFYKVDESMDHYSMSDENNYIVVKHGNGNVLVWTYDELTEAEQNDFKTEFLRLNGNRAGINMFTEFHFFNGFGTIDGSVIAHNWGMYEVVLVGNEIHLNTSADKVSHIYFGRYIIDREEEPEPEPVYDWVAVGNILKPSATGLGSLNDDFYGPGQSWFRKQIIDFTEKNTVIIPINANNPTENDAMIVGHTTITRVGDLHTINYSLMDQRDAIVDPEVGDKAIVVVSLEDAHYDYGTSISFQSATKPQKNLTDGTTFTYEPLVFEYYNHFSVTIQMYEWQEVTPAE